MAEIDASGRAVAPTAGQAVVTVAAPPAGQYDIHVKASVSGAAAADTGNMGLYKGAGTGSPIAAPTPHGISGAFAEETYRGVVLDGATSVTVQAIGAATAAIVYEATLELTKVQ